MTASVSPHRIGAHELIPAFDYIYFVEEPQQREAKELYQQN
jgi:hypothetical protein